ncbi:hypothetical protein JHN46_43080 [Streptomyces sp. MBT33]|nr:hypothetical protein [Streptomyces sp. MBT33]
MTGAAHDRVRGISDDAVDVCDQVLIGLEPSDDEPTDDDPQPCEPFLRPYLLRDRLFQGVAYRARASTRVKQRVSTLQPQISVEEYGSTGVAHPRIGASKTRRTSQEARSERKVVGQHPERLVMAERAPGPEVATVESEHSLGVVLGGKGHVHRIREIQVQVAIAGAHRLGDTQVVLGDLGQDDTTSPASFDA